MLAARTPITTVIVCLKVCHADAVRLLTEAIPLTRTDESNIVGSGVGILLNASDPRRAFIESGHGIADHGRATLGSHQGNVVLGITGHDDIVRAPQLR